MDTTSTDRRLHRSLLALAAAALVALASTPVFAQDDDVPPASALAIAEPADGLAPGQFQWSPEASTTGPVTIVVSLPAQRVHVYRGDTRIGVSTISTGREGHETPTGTFEILEKSRMHHSNKYNNAPMPFMQRLTWDGVALHAGRIPGYPASHGCIRLPEAFAEQLYEVTEKGGRVIIADVGTSSEAVLYPGDRVPVDPWTGLERDAATTDVADASTSAPAVAMPSATTRAAPVLAGN